ncbi:MAG: hypothetical protein L6Q84_08865 [Polyangiaceae bacterium]|nr:hypothetical protein [Polyangiaceae bacterium]
MASGIISPKIREIARQSGVSLAGGGDPTSRIVDACVRRVKGWIDALGPADTFADLINIVAAKLKVHFEVIRGEDDLAAVMHQYLRSGETGFVDLRSELDGSADAVVVRLQKAPSWSDKQYVAVIDARGAKASKEWFSKWHELAHLIAEPQTKFAFRRTLATRRDPVERLMDQLAAGLAFYPELLLPAVQAHGLDLEQPNLRALVAFQKSALDFSSLHAALIATLRHSAVPTVLVEAKVTLKSSEQRAQNQGLLFADAAPTPTLRATTTAHNPEAVRRKFYIHRWMRVPERSVIRRVYGGEIACEHVPTRENLSWWESQGERLPGRSVLVEAMQAGPGRVLALVTRA